MPRRRRDCPICSKKNLAKLSNHLADIHQLSGEERQHYLSKARSLSDQRESEEMLNRKRMRSESDDDMSTASSSEEMTSKETLSEKRMRNESDDETSTAFDEDIFSSSGEEDAVSSEEEAESSEEDAESSEEMNDSDESEEEDPWGVLIHEAAMELRTKHNKLVQSFQNGGLSEIGAKKQAFSEILPDLRKKVGNIYLDRLKWMMQMKRDPVHRKIMRTKDTFVDEDDFDPDEALTAAIKKRNFLLERLLEDRQYFTDNNEEDDDDDDDDDNVSTPYELKSELNYY